MSITPEERPKARSLGPLRELLPFLRPYRGMLLLALGALLVASAAMLALPIALRYLIDEGLSSSSTDTSWRLAEKASTTSTLLPLTSAAWNAGRGASSGCLSRTAVNQKLEPRPSSLS